ncbi:hypothetical protein AF335_00850 [Streptomyces eurocidicus]|uniref:Uncharacterized protein n=1 Tax=Streptomyces eurocidicus TaxID=66423 RepID=A0A2N8P1V0_STREU|nr:hypothetical protein [Streptomyces eurocidicus]MBB5118555.1 hypothetical protein [Streptomyces eurocidicus]MBF6052005.1 hypothetical protein [Streptomyces eurocidicus]PNE34995.1 hypothetical protein AF335_00850 [Streptomyces eurocidicus]
MGWTVLYIAFGVVALWLLGEVLLQYKARLRWRLLAFVGFLGVVAGVVIPSVVVIAVGAIAFAVGQTYVTLSFRRGFSTGWSLRRDKSDDRGDRDEPGRKGKRGKSGVPSGTSDDEPSGAGAPRAGRRRKAERAAEPPAAPALDETAALDLSFPEPGAGPDLMPGTPPATGLGQAPYGGDRTDQPDGFAPAPSVQGGAYGGYGDPGHAPEAPAPDAAGFTGYDAYAGQAPDPSYGQGQGQYAAYSDPYIGSRPQAYENYDAFGQYTPYPQQYGTGGYAADGYGQQQPQSQQYDMDTPPGGVWVPQQRDGDNPPPPGGPQQPYHPQQLPGHDGQQYRY